MFKTLNSQNRYAVLYRIAGPSGPKREHGASSSSWPCWREAKRSTRNGRPEPEDRRPPSR